MKYCVTVLPDAERDLRSVFNWLSARSAGGAAAWYEAARKAIDGLEDTAEHHGLAAESRKLKTPIREKFFKTAQGKRYRLLYRIDGDAVRGLRIRAPGQPPVRRRDLE